jgi:hypothetical protein
MRSISVLTLLVLGCSGDLGPPTPGPDGGVDEADAGDLPMDDAGPIDPGPACVGEPLETSALDFDGVDDHVTMGVAPELALATLTVEAWIRRDGRGRPAGTGVGGLQIVPIAGKGRGEDDGSNVDCNYQFGLVGDVLGADFEDMATGANHPIVGRSAIAMGEWHHVAATYDGTTWRLYLDGALDAERAVNATPRADSIQHFGIGAAFNSMGVAAGRFDGAIDEVRVWDYARSDVELEAARFSTIEGEAGLVGRWALDELTGATDSTATNDGTIVGAAFGEGATLDEGLPPALVASGPSGEVPAAGVTLGVAIEDADSDTFEVTFHLRELTEEDDFTIAVLPDTQYYTVEGNGYEHHFRGQTRWIMDNRVDYDIAGVIHNGDIVDHGPRLYEWGVADDAMSTLEATDALLPDGMPFGMTPGNHDLVPFGETNGSVNFNMYFGIDRFESRGYYGGHYGSDNDENWFTFQAAGHDFIVVNMQWDPTPDPAVLAWARRVFESHPDAFGILNSHYLVNSNGTFGAQGQATYDALRDVPNLHLMTSGHISAEARRTDDAGGHPITSMLADYQGRTQGGNGWMRLWEFSPANGELTVRSYSPSLDMFETDANSEFTIPVDLSGAGGSFIEIGRIDRANGSAMFELDTLSPGRIYEWYAQASDCRHTIRSDVARFTTAP